LCPGIAVSANSEWKKAAKSGHGGILFRMEDAMKRFRTSPRTFSQTFPENFVAAGRDPVRKLWRFGPGDPPIKSSGDLLSMMAQSGSGDDFKDDDDESERRTEERAAEPPPRKAIISIHGKDVEECEIPEEPRRRRAA
jgi:hypothetical protein